MNNTDPKKGSPPPSPATADPVPERAEAQINLHAQLLEGVRESVVASDLEGRILYWGRGAEQLYGYSAAEVLGQPYRNFAGAIEPPDEEAFRKEILAKGSWQGEHRQKHRDGHEFWTSTYISVFTDEQGRPGGYIGIDQDITDRKRTEEALRESESQLQKIFDILPIGLWFADKTGKLLRGNPAGVKIWGAEPCVDPSRYGVFKARHLPSGEEIAPDDWALAHTIREGTTTLEELLEIDAFDGRKKIILNSTAPLLDDNGAIQGAVIVNQDVTDRKRAEEALRESEERYRSILNASPDNITIADLEGRILMTSPSALAMLRCNRDDPLVGHPVFDFIVPEDRERAAADLARMFQDPSPTPDEYRALRADGSQFDVEVNGEFIRDADGRPLQLLLVIRDITARKQAEAALQDSEMRYRTFIDATSDRVFLKDEALRYLFSNRANNAFLGKPAEAVIGHADSELMPKAMATRCRASDQDALRKGRSVASEETMDGTTCQIAKFPVPLPGGRTGVGGYIRDITERKRIEEKLRAGEQQYRDIAANIPGVIYQIHANRVGALVVPYMSDGCEALFESPLAGLDFTGLLFDRMPPGDRALFEQSLAAAARKMERWNLDFRILPAKGQVKWLHGSANPRELPNGTVVWNGVLLDITSLKQAEQALREREAFQNLLMDTIPSPVFYKDRQGRYLGFNKAFETLYGKTKDQLVGKSVFDISPPELAKIYHAQDAELFEKPGTQIYEAPMLDARGNRHDLVFHKASILDAQGAVSGLIGIVLDITDRKRAEEKILQESALNKTIIDSIPGTFYMLDETGHYLRWSTYQRDQIVGKPDEQMPETTALSTIHPDDRALVQEKIGNVLENGVEELVSSRVLLRGGPEFRWLLMTGRRMVVDGRPVLIGIGIDITERKQAEEQVAQQLDELRRWQAVTLGREGRIAEMKREVNALAVRLGQPPPYPSAEGL